MTAQTLWWKEGTCYQVWPASYKDSNGDGIGDIPGIISTLDYLKELGIDIVWLSPMYDSPQKDMGYDISNYEAVYPPFGTLADMDTLLRELHARGMKLILDLVVNHTSDQHAWFRESRSSRTNKYADWYIWKDPKCINGERHPPNNWRAIFGGSAWEYVPERDQYYLHLFVPEQPDLNWENRETRQGIYNSALRFWLDRGLDGFRVDTVNLYSKNTAYPDAPIVVAGEPYQPADQFFTNGPRMHEWLSELRREVLDPYSPREIMMVGELPDTPAPEVLRYVSSAAKELSCVFDFDIVSLGGRHSGDVKKHQVYRHRLPEFKAGILKAQALLNDPRVDAWTTVFLENHDQGRSLSRYATDDPKYREKAAKMLALMLACLSGTLFVYQGQEIGMVNVPKEWDANYLRDVDSLNFYHEMEERYENDPVMMQRALAGLQLVGRDNARLPVRWDGKAEWAGFTDKKDGPWIPVHDNYPEVNVKSQVGTKGSVFEFWKKALKLRKEYRDVLVYGGCEGYDFHDGDVFTFVKTATTAGRREEKKKKKVLVVLNFSDNQQYLDVPESCRTKDGMELLLGNLEDGQQEIGKYLSPWEGRAYLIK